MYLSERARGLLRTIGATAFAAVGVLAIANVDAPWRESDRPLELKTTLSPRRELERRLTLGRPATPATGVLVDLREALGGVELGRQNPFTQLHDLKPLEAVLARGATRFTRQSYRSPRYQEETGYDIVAFDVTHKDQTKSTILAYLERTLDGSELVPVVLLVTNGPERAKQALFRGGELVESQSVPLSVAQSMVAQRLDLSVPFLSVAR